MLIKEKKIKKKSITLHVPRKTYTLPLEREQPFIAASSHSLEGRITIILLQVLQKLCIYGACIIFERNPAYLHFVSFLYTAGPTFSFFSDIPEEYLVEINWEFQLQF